jgi:hypothetical protein
MDHLNCGASDENRLANRQREAGKASERDGMLPSYKGEPREKREGEKSAQQTLPQLRNQPR